MEIALLTAEQMRAGRAILNLTKYELAKICGLNQATIARLESQEGRINGQMDTIFRIITALEERGIVFIDGGAFRRVRTKEQPSPALAEAS